MLKRVFYGKYNFLFFRESVFDLIHDLYLIHWDQEKNLLFINSTNNKANA